jgi:3-oxoacyl-[acyl-carrier-protein] synthase II
MSAPAPRRVAVTGIGLLSPFGSSLDALAEGLFAGRSPFAAVASIDVSRFGPVPPRAAAIAGFDPAVDLEEGNHRMLDRTSHLATAAAKHALADACWPAGREAGLALGTMFGSIKTIAEFDRRALTAGPLYAKPMDFANSVINAAAGQAAIWHHLTGGNATVTGGPVAGAAALAYAADLIRWGRADAMLAGGAEELAFESLLGFERSGGVVPADGEPRPFGAGRAGFLLGEGVALLMLEEWGAARDRGAAVRAEIVGWGGAFDPSRGKREESGVDAAVRAIDAALLEAGLGAEAIDIVSAGANGSPAGDRTEALALARVLGRRLPEVPVTAVKSMLGEMLGASGAFQATALLLAFERGQIPGIRGLGELDPELPPIDATEAARPIAARFGLLHAAGLDGHHAALVLARADS